MSGPHDFMHSVHPEIGWSCGVVGPERAQEISDKGGAEAIEAMMMLARAMKDEKGLRLMFNLPPALAAAIVLMHSDPRGPMVFASEFLGLGKAR